METQNTFINKAIKETYDDMMVIYGFDDDNMRKNAVKSTLQRLYKKVNNCDGVTAIEFFNRGF